MKTKHGLLFGFAVIAIAAIFTLTGCPTEDDGGGVAWRSELVPDSAEGSSFGIWSGLVFTNSEDGSSMITLNGWQWTLYATDDKPAGTVGSTFTVARYYPGEGKTNNDERVKEPTPLPRAAKVSILPTRKKKAPRLRPAMLTPSPPEPTRWWTIKEPGTWQS